MRHLYSLRGQVLAQDQGIFLSSITTHLSEPLHRLQAWVTANRLLILHSAKQAKSKALIGTKHLPSYFPTTGRRTSKLGPRNKPTQKSKCLLSSYLTKHFSIIGSTASKLPPTIEEPEPPETTAPDTVLTRRRQQCYHQLCLSSLFPDHPT